MSPPLAQAPVKGFLGENRLLPDDLLTDNISPDAQNVDYSSGTIKNRGGYAKLHDAHIQVGGLAIENVGGNNKCVLIKDAPQLHLVDDFTLEVWVQFNTDNNFSGNTKEILTKRDSVGGTGWVLLHHASDIWRFRMFNSVGVAVNINTTTALVVVGEIYHVAVSRSGTTVTITATTLSDGTFVTGSGTISGESVSSRDLYVNATEGTTPANVSHDAVFDELRIWDDVRTSTELADTLYRELNEEEILDANLQGYWKFNEGVWNITDDESVNKNHANLFVSGPSFKKGFVPHGEEDDFAVRLDGHDDIAESAYHAALAPILDTGSTWTVEAWLRLDSGNRAAVQHAVQLGDAAADNGSPFAIYVDTSLNLTYSYATTTTHNNATHDTTYNIVVGQAFHVALVRDGDDILTYINGVLIDTLTGVTSENGPTSATSHGMKFGHKESGGDSLYGPFTIDEVRLWASVRSSAQIAEWWDSEYPDTQDTNLVGYWRFNADDEKRDETGNADITTGPTPVDKPRWTYGHVYPLKRDRILLAAPLSLPIRGDNVFTGRSIEDRELLVCTRTDFWTVQGSKAHQIKRLETPGGDNTYSYTHFRENLLCGNGLGRNYRYNGRDVPISITLPTWTDSVTVTPTGAGSGWNGSVGDYTYYFARYDSNSDTESLVDVTGVTAAMLSTHDTAEITSMDPSDAGYPNITHTKIYRLDTAAGATEARLLATVAGATSTYSDDGSSVSDNELMNTLRGHPDPHKFVVVYNDRIFLLNDPSNPSAYAYSEAGTYDFPGTNIEFVDRGDGDELTGGVVFRGVCVLFKRNSIHALTGTGSSTFSLRKLFDGIGCVSHNTIAVSARGIYFLSHDGVYVYDGSGLTYISHSHQPVFNAMDHREITNAVATFAPETHQYIVSADFLLTPTGSAYDVTPEWFTHYWKLADGTDEVGVATDFVITGDVTYIPDPERGVVVNIPQGTSQNIAITDDSLVGGDLDADLTLGCWVLPSKGQAAFSYPLSLDNASATPLARLIVNASPSVIFPDNDSIGFTGLGMQIQSGIIIGSWSHIVVSKVGATISLYVNGEFRLSGVAASDTLGSAIDGAFIGNAASFSTLHTMVQNAFYINDIGLSARGVRDIYDLEALGQQASERKSYAYDEETDSWDKWDKAFDTLVIAQHLANRDEVVGSQNLYVNKLLTGPSDGAQFVSGGASTKSGTLTAQTSAKITDSGAKFLTDAGLKGVTLVAIPTDTTQAIQRRTILYNTDTVLYLDAPFSFAVTGTYHIGPIEMHWESRWMDFGDDWVVKRLMYILIWVKETPTTVTIKHKSDSNETWVTTTFSTSDEFVRFAANNRGRKIKFRFEHVSAADFVEIESFRGVFRTAGVVK